MAIAKKRKKWLWVVLALVAVVLIILTLLFKQYYDYRYVLDDKYYTVVPLDYDITPYQDADMGRTTEYILTGYNENGESKELEFQVYHDAHELELYPPGTFIEVSKSKQLVIGKRALDESDVPEKAMEKIMESFTPSSATTLEEYAEERTTQLVSFNTPSAEVTVSVDNNTLIYTYVYDVGAKGLAEEAKDLLDPVYTSQFRTDKKAFPELTAIFLEIKLTDGTVIFSQKYDQWVKFGYELEQP